MSNHDMKYIDYGGKRYVYLNPTGDKVWQATEEGFEEIDREELPDKVKGELVKEAI